MSYIRFENVYKDYGDNRGIFNISFEVKKGESFGIVGINGAGKTTILRHIMGFIKQDSGKVLINDLDSFKDAKEIKKLVAYIPGEINFPQVNSGNDFIKLQGEFWNKEDLTKTYDVVKKLQLDARANVKRMSKGMKQKTGIAVSFLPDNDIYIFDEPTTGLDPLMRRDFIDLVLQERKKGKTFVISNHMFDELEECCDRVAMIKDGRILRIVDIKSEVHNNENKNYKIEFKTKEDYQKFINEKITFIKKDETQNQVHVIVHDKNINEFMKLLANYDVLFIKENKVMLEDLFILEYKKDLERGK